VSDDTPETVHAARIPTAASTEARRRRRGGALIKQARNLFRHRCGGHVVFAIDVPRRRPTARSKRADALDWSVRSPQGDIYDSALRSRKGLVICSGAGMVVMLVGRERVSP
jgi:hypothetical protein